MKKVITELGKIDEVITSFNRTTEEVFSLGELRRLLSLGRKLRMKFGVDVTAPDLHIGHAVNLWMYRKLQEFGHKIVFLIGDFTTQIGDPTGKNKKRPIIPSSQINKNAELFIKQAKMILIDDPDLIEVRRNSEWYDVMTAKELLSLISTVTHDRLMSRDMFKKRVEEGKEIYEHELIYPILQGYDSVVLESDITIIGSDQLYNEMMGRFFQERFRQSPQVIITTKITPGIDGGEKQSKSLGNYVGLSHSPREKFGRVMSMADNLVVDYFKVYTEISLQGIAEIEKKLSLDPMKSKLLLAEEIVRRYHGEKTAKEELKWFQETFSEGKIPENIPTIFLNTNLASVFEIAIKCFGSEKKSNSDVKRLIRQGAVRIGGQKKEDSEELISIPINGIEVKIGKRKWFKVKPQ